MRRLVGTVLSLSLLALLASACSHASRAGGVVGSDAPSFASSTETVRPRPEASPRMLRLDDIRMVAPALEKYTQGRLLGEVWKRPGLAPRDRSIVTLAALVARNQTIDMPYYLNLALDNGVKPREISEIITHLAFYSGWPNARSAVAVAKDVFAERRIGSDQLAPGSPQLLPLDEASKAQRASRVGEQFGNVAPGVVQYTTDVLFRDLWLRPDLAPRDRSLVTVSALVASGQSRSFRHTSIAQWIMVSRRRRPQRRSPTWHSTSAGQTSSPRSRSRRTSSRSVRIDPGVRRAGRKPPVHGLEAEINRRTLLTLSAQALSSMAWGHAFAEEAQRVLVRARQAA
jgi:4-carboxymuconolactone decarboxylase